MLQPVNGKFDMPTLPYGIADLAPALSQESILFHFGKHLQTYVNNLNAALPGSVLKASRLRKLLKALKGESSIMQGRF